MWWESSTLDSHEVESIEKKAVTFAKELCLDVSDALRKPELIQAILAIDAHGGELSE